MKYLKRLTVIMLILALSVTLMACQQKEKSVLNISMSEAVYSKDELIQTADLILKGKVLSKDQEIMTNPGGTKNGIMNEQITTYTIEIDELYKGAYADETISVKTTNGMGLSPDLILYGEDENDVLAEPLERFDLSVGKECVLILRYFDSDLESRAGYYVYGEDQGYFILDGNGAFKSRKDWVKYSPDLATLPQEIAQAMQ